MRNKIKYTNELGQKSKIAVGQFYREDDSQDLYIVAMVQPPGHFALISLTDGISWTEPTADINEVYDSFVGSFTLITDAFTITPGDYDR
jgi:hypothetical protein